MHGFKYDNIALFQHTFDQGWGSGWVLPGSGPDPDSTFQKNPDADLIHNKQPGNGSYQLLLNNIHLLLFSFNRKINKFDIFFILFVHFG